MPSLIWAAMCRFVLSDSSSKFVEETLDIEVRDLPWRLWVYHTPLTPGVL